MTEALKILTTTDATEPKIFQFQRLYDAGTRFDLLNIAKEVIGSELAISKQLAIFFDLHSILHMDIIMQTSSIRLFDSQDPGLKRYLEILAVPIDLAASQAPYEKWQDLGEEFYHFLVDDFINHDFILNNETGFDKLHAKFNARYADWLQKAEIVHK